MGQNIFYHVLSSHADYRTHAKDGQHEIFRRAEFQSLTGQERRQKQQNNCTLMPPKVELEIASPSASPLFPFCDIG